MGLVEDLKKILDEEKHSINTNQADFMDFYNDLKNKGLVLKQSYNLPLIDTLGTISLEEMENSKDNFFVNNSQHKICL